MSPSHIDWLEQFYAAPNGLAWSHISDGTEPAAVAEVLRPWLKLLSDDSNTGPVILPFVRAGVVTGWYAVARNPDHTDELRDLLMAWFGFTRLSRFEATTAAMSDPLAAILRNAFRGVVFRFSGADATANHRIGSDLIALAHLLSRKPHSTAVTKRPIGIIRGEFDRALLLRDETNASILLDELKGIGRLSDENLRYLEVRFRAGLGLWPQIAHDHWLIRTLSDLLLPPQVLSDLIEALYRTHLDSIEEAGDLDALMGAFSQHISGRYPRLFASRRGIRTERVVKAFLIYEYGQALPNQKIISELAELLPQADREQSLFGTICRPAPTAATAVDYAAEADVAFDDNQFDRAFEFYLAGPAAPKSLGRAILCASFIDTAEVTARLATYLSGAAAIEEQLSPNLKLKFDALMGRHTEPAAGDVAVAPPPSSTAGDWLSWARDLRQGIRLPLPADASITWAASAVLQDPKASLEFADSIGVLSSDVSLARQAVPIVYAAFIDDLSMVTSAKPIAINLCMIIAVEEGLSKVDLALLYQIAVDLIASGMSTAEYVSLIDIVIEVEQRVASYSHLAWALDMAEAFAVAAAPSDAARGARDQFFHLVVAKAQTFAHRLRLDERQTFRTLARDYGVDATSLGPLTDISVQGDGEILPDLSGKTIGIYTLVEAAGVRAKAELETMFPGVIVSVNGDLVATERLTNLATSADYFVFAWRSSSHAAYYCIKDAMKGRDLILPQGKGTASILRAVIEAVQ
ncbi:hypothetical protein GR200_30905 [Rhizobium leguminosarum]|uniref:protein DpdD n=1 Tax=Rhizobium leguminosarum TaxID=384 RepID=UPI0013B66BCE|nr:protein DpdD [Rhizobium leguminosarum]NEI59441.1 hypothetical protein [Rhizobium leguminosarum]NEI88281.1 hypothetical protein [Rhizobium leguminosarum]